MFSMFESKLVSPAGRAGGFALALTALASSAKAQVLVFQPNPSPFTSAEGFFASVSFDPLSNSITDNPVNGDPVSLTVSGCGGATDFTLGFSQLNGSGSSIASIDFLGSGGRVSVLSEGADIDATMTWLPAEGTPIQFTQNAYSMGDAPVYFGYRFQTDTMAANDWFYGYGLVSGQDGSSYPRNTTSIYSWAYESQENVGIQAGAIPEPTTATAAALGLSILVLYLAMKRRFGPTRKSNLE